MPPKKPSTPSSSQTLKKRPVLMVNQGLAQYMNVPKTATAASTRAMKQQSGGGGGGVFRFDNTDARPSSNYPAADPAMRMANRTYGESPFAPASTLHASAHAFDYLPQSTKNARVSSDQVPSHKFQALMQRQSAQGSFSSKIPEPGRMSFEKPTSAGGSPTRAGFHFAESRRAPASASGGGSKQLSQPKRGPPNQPAKGDEGPATPQEGHSLDKTPPSYLKAQPVRSSAPG